MAKFFILIFILFNTKVMAQVQIDGVQYQKEQHLSYYFGQVPVHTTRTASFRITNSAEVPVDVEKITISGAMFRASTNCPGRMEPKEVCAIRVYFQPYWEGYFVGEVKMKFSDKDNIFISLSGTGSSF